MSTPGARECPHTPSKKKFFTAADALRHIERTNTLSDRPYSAREPYDCDCGWVHVRRVQNRKATP